MKRFFFDEHDDLKPGLVFAVLALGVLVLVGFVFHVDRETRRQRFAVCMADRHDVYFCDLWADHHGFGREVSR